MLFLRSRKFGFRVPDPNSVWVGRRCIVTSCRGVILTRFGGPEVLELRPNVDVPDLKPNEVLVRARAVSINPLDTRMRSGYGRSIFEPLLPLILGRDVSGEVSAIGASVRKLNVGQEVFGALHPTAVRGTYADYAILSEDELTPKPVSITHVEASAIPFAALTAWRALKSTARITEPEPDFTETHFLSLSLSKTEEEEDGSLHIRLPHDARIGIRLGFRSANTGTERFANQVSAGFVTTSGDFSSAQGFSSGSDAFLHGDSADLISSSYSGSGLASVNLHAADLFSDGLSSRSTHGRYAGRYPRR